MRANRIHAGFTLVEMIVAVSILALVAVLGWRGLDGIVRARTTLTEHADQLRGLRLIFSQLELDCMQIAPPSALGAPQTLLAGQDMLVLVRLVLEQQQPTRMQVVAYRLSDGQLVRQASPPTRDPGLIVSAWQAAIANRNLSALPPTILQTHVLAMHLRLWDDYGHTWQSVGEHASGSSNSSSSAAATNTNTTQAAGLEVALQLANQSAPLVKSFLVGAT